MTVMSVGQNIKKFRRAKGLSQRQLAEVIGSQKESVSAWERDLRTPRHESLAKVAAALDVDVDTLLDARGGEVRTQVEYLNGSQLRRLDQAAHAMTPDGVEMAVKRFCEISRLSEYQM